MEFPRVCAEIIADMKEPTRFEKLVRVCHATLTDEEITDNGYASTRIARLRQLPLPDVGDVGGILPDYVDIMLTVDKFALYDGERRYPVGFELSGLSGPFQTRY